jgi:peptide methionine sulfoxide reductase MsrA
VHDQDQRAVVEKLMGEYQGLSGKKVYTDVEQATDFYRAEEYHQKYVEKSRSRYN